MPRKPRKRHGPSEPITAFGCTFVDPQSETELYVPIRKKVNLRALIVDDSGWPKTTEEFNVGEYAPGLISLLDTPLEKLESVIDPSPSYFTAKRAVCLINRQGKAVPHLRAMLIRGLVAQRDVAHRVDTSDLEDKIALDGKDFTPEDYQVMTDVLYAHLRYRCEESGIKLVGKQVVRDRYLGGIGFLPKEWRYLEFFEQLNSEFSTFTQGFTVDVVNANGQTEVIYHVQPNSRIEYYVTFIGKRRKLRRCLYAVQEEMRRILQAGGTPDVKYIIDTRIKADVVPELKLLYEHAAADASQNIALRLKRKQPLTESQYIPQRKEYEQRGRRQLRLIENAAPTYDSYREFSKFPLCCVTHLVSDVFKYALLVALQDEFKERRYPDCWINELNLAVLNQDGVRNPLTKYVFSQLDLQRRAVVAFPDSVTDRMKRRANMVDYAADIGRRVRAGEFEGLLDLNPGEFSGCYDRLTRMVAALPKKYWSSMKFGYQTKHPLEYESVGILKEPDEQVESALGRARRLGMDALTKSQREAYEECERLKEEIFPGGHKDYLFLSAFVVDPYVFPWIPGDEESVSVQQTLADTAQMIKIQKLLKQSYPDEEWLDRDTIGGIFKDLKITGMMKYVHTSNFLPVGGFDIDLESDMLPTGWSTN